MKEFLEKWNFKETNSYKVIDNDVYRVSINGLHVDNSFRKTTRKVGKYRIVAKHFNCNLPFTKYYLIYDNTICESREYYTEWSYNILQDMTNDLKELV